MRVIHYVWLDAGEGTREDIEKMFDAAKALPANASMDEVSVEANSIQREGWFDIKHMRKVRVKFIWETVENAV